MAHLPTSPEMKINAKTIQYKPKPVIVYMPNQYHTKGDRT